MWKQINHGLNYCQEYGQPGTINFGGPAYDQPGFNLWLVCQSDKPVFVWEGNLDKFKTSTLS